MGIRSRYRQVRSQVKVNTNVVHPQVVVSKRQGFLKGLIYFYGNSLWLVLAGKTQEVLYDAVRALRLLIELF